MNSVDVDFPRAGWATRGARVLLQRAKEKNAERKAAAQDNARQRASQEELAALQQHYAKNLAK